MRVCTLAPRLQPGPGGRVQGHPGQKVNAPCLHDPASPSSSFSEAPHSETAGSTRESTLPSVQTEEWRPRILRGNRRLSSTSELRPRVAGVFPSTALRSSRMFESLPGGSPCGWLLSLRRVPSRLCCCGLAVDLDSPTFHQNAVGSRSREQSPRWGAPCWSRSRSQAFRVDKLEKSFYRVQAPNSKLRQIILKFLDLTTVSVSTS